jgi:hypothetical protein
MDAILHLSLTPEQARVVGAWALVLVVILDLLASSDDVPFNTPRDWLLWLSQWKSLGLWCKERRRAATKGGRRWAPFSPLHYLPVTGAGVPFMCAVLVGHFFHPGLGPLLGPGGFVGLASCLGAAAVLSAVTYFTKPGTGQRLLFVVALVGVVWGALAWPVRG